MVRAGAMRLADHLVGQPPDRIRVVDVGECLSQHCKGPDRRLQLMADVGNEVSSHRIQAGALADIVDGHERTAVLQRDRLHGQHRSRWADELDGLPAGVTA